MLRVFEAGEESPSMYVVESLGEDPFVFSIVDFEMAIWWNAVLS
jgi:hypothetical protein